MYSELFSLNQPPFRLTPDPEFLFASKQHARAKAYMESTIWLADGFVVITGEIGAGKTTLIESFLADLPEDVVLAHVSQTQLSPIEFLQAVLVEFGFREFHDRKVELLSTLKDFMIEQYTQGKTLLLIVDEAQNLSHKVLEEIRLLSGIESQKEKPLRIILAGQPELSDKLDSLRLEQLRQRVRLRFHLTTLTKRETADYIQHRLDIAGANGRKIFDKDSIELIFRYAGGVPRLTNVLCDTAMLCGFSEGKDKIDVGLINEAVNELQWVEYEKRFENRGRFSASHAARRPAERKLRLVDVERPSFSEHSGETEPEHDAEARAAPKPDTEAAAAEPEDEPAATAPEDVRAATESESETETETETESASKTPRARREPAAARLAGPPLAARFDVQFKDQYITGFDLPFGRAVVGRTSDNDLQIRSRFVSRHHIQITTDDEKTVVEDLNSTNGMLVGGKRLQYRLMVDGDVIQLGEHKLVYRDLRSAELDYTSPQPFDDPAHAETYTPHDDFDSADSPQPDTPESDDGSADEAAWSGGESDANTDDGETAWPDDADADDEKAGSEEYDGAKTRVLE
ncbi:MAG TPA: AAA family ATPase [Gammaproteobacteria bacterium]|nr:AAA family ATPase [Gammaproteobacteria bacterium]